jgi:hypothetical protein
MTNNLCRLISFFLTFQIINMMPKAWAFDGSLLLASEPVQTKQKQVGNGIKFDINHNKSSQITLPKGSVSSDLTDQTQEKVGSDMKSVTKKKLTLESAINRALEANRGIRDVMDQVEGARLSLVAAESDFELKIVPAGDVSITGSSDEDSSDTLGAGISLQKKFDVGTDILVTPKTRKSDDLYNTGVDTTLIQPLLRGFGKEFNLSGVRSAEFGTRSARRNLYLRQVNTVVLTIGAIYDVVRQRELYRLNE